MPGPADPVTVAGDLGGLAPCAPAHEQGPRRRVRNKTSEAPPAASGAASSSRPPARRRRRWRAGVLRAALLRPVTLLDALPPVAEVLLHVLPLPGQARVCLTSRTLRASLLPRVRLWGGHSWDAVRRGVKDLVVAPGVAGCEPGGLSATSSRFTQIEGEGLQPGSSHARGGPSECRHARGGLAIAEIAHLSVACALLPLAGPSHKASESGAPRRRSPAATAVRCWRRGRRKSSLPCASFVVESVVVVGRRRSSLSSSTVVVVAVPRCRRRPSLSSTVVVRRRRFLQPHVA